MPSRRAQTHSRRLGAIEICENALFHFGIRGGIVVGPQTQLGIATAATAKTGAPVSPYHYGQFLKLIGNPLGNGLRGEVREGHPLAACVNTGIGCSALDSMPDFLTLLWFSTNKHGEFTVKL